MQKTKRTLSILMVFAILLAGMSQAHTRAGAIEYIAQPGTTVQTITEKPTISMTFETNEFVVADEGYGIRTFESTPNPSPVQRISRSNETNLTYVVGSPTPTPTPTPTQTATTKTTKATASTLHVAVGEVCAVEPETDATDVTWSYAVTNSGYISVSRESGSASILLRVKGLKEGSTQIVLTATAATASGTAIHEVTIPVKVVAAGTDTSSSKGTTSLNNSSTTTGGNNTTTKNDSDKKSGFPKTGYLKASRTNVYKAANQKSKIDTISNTNPVTVQKASGNYYKISYKSGKTTKTGFVAQSAVTFTRPSAVVKETSVKLSASSKTLKINQTFALTATVLPSNATNKTVTWKSSNTKVATVDTNGKVTAVRSGTATITATTSTAKRTASCKITVNNTIDPEKPEKPVNPDIPTTLVTETSVTLSSASETLKKGAAVTLTATVLPSNATNKTVAWTSSNTKVATVNNGNVTAVSAGKATITATTNSAKLTASCEITVTDVPDVPDFDVQAQINEVVRLVNVERTKEELSSLTPDANLMAACKIRADELTEYYSHTRPDGTSFETVLSHLKITAWGENIAHGYTSAAAVMDGWMNSPGHRANILTGHFGKIGVGCVKIKGTVYWVQIFTS